MSNTRDFVVAFPCSRQPLYDLTASNGVVVVRWTPTPTAVCCSLAERWSDHGSCYDVGIHQLGHRRRRRCGSRGQIQFSRAACDAFFGDRLRRDMSTDVTILADVARLKVHLIIYRRRNVNMVALSRQLKVELQAVLCGAVIVMNTQQYFAIAASIPTS